MTTATTVRPKKKLIPFGPRDAGAPMTLDEFEEADFDLGWRYEIIRGVLVVSPSPLEEERDANEELGHWLRSYKERHPDGRALNLTLHEQNIRTRTQNRRCDRAIWAGLGRRPRTRGRPDDRDVPAIIVEFPSSRPADQRRDYVEKQVEYRELGVKEYWIIDRFSRRMFVFRWQGSRWARRVLSERDTYKTTILPGFKLKLAALFARMDEFEGA